MQGTELTDFVISNFHELSSKRRVIKNLRFEIPFHFSFNQNDMEPPKLDFMSR